MMLRSTRRRRLIVIMTTAIVVAISAGLVRWYGGDTYAAYAAKYVVILSLSLGLMASVITMLQEVTDRVEHR